MAVPLLSAVTDWYCPNCGKRDRTREPKPHVRFHVCPKMRYLSAPLLRAGTAAKVVLSEWEDYVGAEMVQRDPERKRPIRAITTTRDHGQDVMVFAPTATAKGA